MADPVIRRRTRKHWEYVVLNTLTMAKNYFEAFAKQDRDLVDNWIKYNPDLDPQLTISRTGQHDGTHMFSYEMEGYVMELLLNRRVYCKSDPIRPDTKYITYEVGNLVNLVAYGQVPLPCGPGLYSGQRERFYVPVRVIQHT